MRDKDTKDIIQTNSINAMQETLFSTTIKGFQQVCKHISTALPNVFNIL